MIEFAEKKKKLTQVQVLAKELARRPLTGKQIEHNLGIMNYKGRVCDLRDAIAARLDSTDDALDILTTKHFSVKSRWGVSRPAIYRIEKEYRKEYKKFLHDFLK